MFIFLSPSFLYTYPHSLGQESWRSAREKWVLTCNQEVPLAREMYTHDIDSIVTNISTYSSFTQAVPLDLMAEVLETIWIESPLL